jgi:hypothetical protein
MDLTTILNRSRASHSSNTQSEEERSNSSNSSNPPTPTKMEIENPYDLNAYNAGGNAGYNTGFPMYNHNTDVNIFTQARYTQHQQQQIPQRSVYQHQHHHQQQKVAPYHTQVKNETQHQHGGMLGMNMTPGSALLNDHPSSLNSQHQTQGKLPTP